MHPVRDHAHRDNCCCTVNHLTPREIDVLALVALGCTNDEIAGRLSLSSQTVAHHLREMLRRMQARNRAELVARAYVEGVLEESSWPPTASGRRCLRMPANAVRPLLEAAGSASGSAAAVARPRVETDVQVPLMRGVGEDAVADQVGPGLNGVKLGSH